MGGFRWVFYALVAVLIIGSLWASRSGRVPEWEKCKESLFQQMLSDVCTPRRGFEPGGNGGGDGDVPVQSSPGKERSA